MLVITDPKNLPKLVPWPKLQLDFLFPESDNYYNTDRVRLFKYGLKR